jgi:hypothetical protein
MNFSFVYVDKIYTVVNEIFVICLATLSLEYAFQ